MLPLNCVFHADWPIAVVLEECTGSWPAGFETLNIDTFAHMCVQTFLIL